MRLTSIHFAAAIGLVAAFVLSGDPAFAQSSAGTTHTENATESFLDVMPTCDANEDDATIAIAYDEVRHITEGPNGSFQMFMQKGTYVAVPLDATLQSLSGSFTIRGVFHENQNGAVNGSSVFSVQGAYADGTKINFTVTSRFGERPSGASFAFTHCRG